MSRKPGATIAPDASSSRAPRRSRPISVMRPSSTATSARYAGAPVPSTTVPPRIARSAVIARVRRRRTAGVRQVCRVEAVEPQRVVPEDLRLHVARDLWELEELLHRGRVLRVRVREVAREEDI